MYLEIRTIEKVKPWSFQDSMIIIILNKEKPEMKLTKVAEIGGILKYAKKSNNKIFCFSWFVAINSIYILEGPNVFRRRRSDWAISSGTKPNQEEEVELGGFLEWLRKKIEFEIPNCCTSEQFWRWLCLKWTPLFSSSSPCYEKFAKKNLIRFFELLNIFWRIELFNTCFAYISVINFLQ